LDGDWGDRDGGCYTRTFDGPMAEQRARDYFDALIALVEAVAEWWPRAQAQALPEPWRPAALPAVALARLPMPRAERGGPTGVLGDPAR
jgi:hypothetical protein